MKRYKPLFRETKTKINEMEIPDHMTNKHKDGEVWQLDNGKFGGKYDGKVEYFYDKRPAATYAKQGVLPASRGPYEPGVNYLLAELNKLLPITDDQVISVRCSKDGKIKTGAMSLGVNFLKALEIFIKKNITK